MSGETIAIDVEANVDEMFGDSSIGEYLDRPRKETSKAAERLKMLCEAVFGGPACGAVGNLRYQLLHASAAVLIRAKSAGASLGLLLVHEFKTDKWDMEKSAANLADYKSFVAYLAGMKPSDVRPGEIIGPINVRGGQFVPGEIPLFIGKLVSGPSE